MVNPSKKPERVKDHTTFYECFYRYIRFGVAIILKIKVKFHYKQKSQRKIQRLIMVNFSHGLQTQVLLFSILIYLVGRKFVVPQKLRIAYDLGNFFVLLLYIFLSQ